MGKRLKELGLAQFFPEDKCTRTWPALNVVGQLLVHCLRALRFVLLMQARELASKLKALKRQDEHHTIVYVDLKKCLPHFCNDVVFVKPPAADGWTRSAQKVSPCSPSCCCVLYSIFSCRR